MTAKKTVLVVDDDASIRHLLETVLVNNGYVVSSAESAEIALKRILTIKPDLILLDLQLTDLNGLECCKRIRSGSVGNDTPIILVSSHNSEVYRITALESGADDFIGKPFSPGELLARVKAVLRRVKRETAHHPVAIVNGKDEFFVLNRDKSVVKVSNKEFSLTPKEYAMLDLFVRAKGNILTRDAISVQVWEHENLATSRTIDVHLARLRKKLGKYGKAIQTIGKLGYKYEPDW